MLGEFVGTVDSKRRLSLPSKLKTRLQLGEKETLYLARGLDGCVWLLTEAQWADVEESLTKLRQESFGFGNKQMRAFLREFYRRCAEVQLDSHGRVTLPATLKDLTGIVKEVIFIVLPERTEIWAAENDPSFDDYDETAERLFG